MTDPQFAVYSMLTLGVPCVSPQASSSFHHLPTPRSQRWRPPLQLPCTQPP